MPPRISYKNSNPLQISIDNIINNNSLIIHDENRLNRFRKIIKFDSFEEIEKTLRTIKNPIEYNILKKMLRMLYFMDSKK